MTEIATQQKPTLVQYMGYKAIEREIVHANLLLFPIFSKRVYGLIRHFSSE